MKCEFEYRIWDEPCEGEVKVRNAMTAYHFVGEKNSPLDPNRDFTACHLHWEAYRDYWMEMWKNVPGY